jgi:uncharacterized protein YndB with AHSA1/START domain
MAAYNFITIWRFQEPVERVWEAINAAENYPKWWRDILFFECLTPENPRGVGAKGRRAVRGFLPYSLVYMTTITKSEAPWELAYTADGDLVGSGSFVLKEKSETLSSDVSGPLTEVTIYWNVDTKGKWLKRLAPLLKWLFAANHNYVMRRGERGLAQWLAKR